MYGLSSLNDGKKQAKDLNPTGNSFKGTWAFRDKYFEGGLMVRYSTLSDDVEFEDIKGDFTRKDLTLGAQIGFWAFSWFKLHGGYAYHGINEKIDGDYTAQQDEDIAEQFGLVDKPVFGVYGGADLVLFRTNRFQFFANYDYYYLNSLKAHDWEGMVGIRLYLAPSNVGKGNFFIQMFKDLLAPKDK